MLEDYETGLRRGKMSRHTVGKLRWVVIFSVAVNLFLVYKLWITQGEISFLRESNSDLSSKIQSERKLGEHYKQQLALAETQRAQCDKNSKAIDEKGNECENARRECIDSLDTTSSKLIETSNDLKTAQREKEELQTKLEDGTSELQKVKEQVTKLQTDLSNSNRQKQELEAKLGAAGQAKQTENPAKHPEIRDIEDEQKKLSPVLTENQGKNVEHADATGQGKSVALEEENVTAPKEEAVAPNEENGVAPSEDAKNSDKPTEEDKKEDVEEVIPVYIECDFSGGAEEGKCNYKMQPSDPHWIFGKPPFLPTGKDSSQCIYIDETIANSGKTMDIIFQPIETEKCLKMALNVTIIGSGHLSVSDNEVKYEVTMETENNQKPVWEVKRFNFDAAPSHDIKISGSIEDVGSVAIASVVVSEGECGSAIKANIGFEEEGIEPVDEVVQPGDVVDVDDDKKVVDELTQ